MAGATSCLGADPGVGPCPGRTAGFVDEDEGCLRREHARQEAEAPEPARPQRQQLSRLAAMPPDAAGGVCGSAVEADPTFLQFGAVGTDAASRSMMFSLVKSWLENIRTHRRLLPLHVWAPRLRGRALLKPGIQHWGCSLGD